jgi:hypothetical protein
VGGGFRHGSALPNAEVDGEKNTVSQAYFALHQTLHKVQKFLGKKFF